MEIGALASSALYQMNANSVRTSSGVDQPTVVGVKMLANQIDASEAQGAGLIKAMEMSVNPNLGGNFDAYA